MGNTGGILRNGLKGETEGLIRIGVFYSQGWRAEHLVLKKINLRIDIGNMLFSSQDESMIGGTGSKICHMRLFFQVKFDGYRIRPEKAADSFS